MKRISVGSKNPVKIACVKRAFEAVFPEEIWDVVGVDVASGVSDQPMSDQECIQGARKRARGAIHTVGYDFGVGIEGGLQEIEGVWFECGWIVVVDRKGLEGIGSSLRICVPELFMKHIREGKELGVVHDIIFGQENSKQKAGYFGVMTKNIITREDGYMDGVIVALARWVHEDLFS